jgi:hypothetical protein
MPSMPVQPNNNTQHARTTQQQYPACQNNPTAMPSVTEQPNSNAQRASTTQQQCPVCQKNPTTIPSMPEQPNNNAQSHITISDFQALPFSQLILNLML